MRWSCPCARCWPGWSTLGCWWTGAPSPPFGQMLDERIQADEALIYELAGEQFNINSTQQFGKILFDKLGLPPVKKTKTGYSTNAEVLEKLRGQAPPSWRRCWTTGSWPS